MKSKWPAPAPQPTTRLRGAVRPMGGFHSPQLRKLAAAARRARGSRWAVIKPKRVTRAVLWRGWPFYWTIKGYYRRGSGDRRPLHHLIWEAHSGKKMPRGHEVFFKDRDHHNFCIRNLAMISKAECHRRIMALGEIPPITFEQRSRGRQLANTRKSRARVALLLQSFQQKDNYDHQAKMQFLAQRREIYHPQHRA